ncbi:MAG TPA: hypothetical protein EYG03_12120 [Planctomycetes bacterium]|nr:hypothetical protein [Fuerstiella sp.]HIK92713.1 hypothetical protein [Planctomycetota bacterium]
MSVRDEDVAELEQKLLEVVSNFEEERSEWQSSVSQLTAVPDRHDADPSKLAEYEAIICELRDQLDTALNAPGTTGSDRQLGDNADSSVVDDLQRDLAVKDELLTELKVQLGGRPQHAETRNTSSCNTQSWMTA